MEKVRGKKVTSYSILLILSTLIIVALWPGNLLAQVPEEESVRLNHDKPVTTEQVRDENTGSMTFAECNVFGINKIINDYYDAYVVEGDTELLRYIDTFGDINQEKREFAIKNVEQYMNIRCYYMEGLVDNSYLVVSYAYVKYYDIDTTVPEIGLFYVRMNSSGNYYICNSMTSNDISSYNKLMFEGNAVAELKANARYELESACEVDLNLKEFVQSNLEYFEY